MNFAPNMLFEYPVAAAFGAAGLACQLVWPLFRMRRRILAGQFGAASGYATQYALLDQWSGAGVCTFGATQTAIALLFGERQWLRHLGFAFIPMAGLLSYVMWSGVASAFATVAFCLVVIGRMQRDTLRMRAVILAASPFGISYDLAVGAGPALAGAILSCAIGLIAFRREWLARRHVSAKPFGRTSVRGFRHAMP